MGIPFRRLICASNANNTLTEFINTGVYDIRARQIQKTQSPAIDILKASNLERFLYHMSDRNDQLVRKCFKELEENQCFEVSGQVSGDLVMWRQEPLKWCETQFPIHYKVLNYWWNVCFELVISHVVTYENLLVYEHSVRCLLCSAKYRFIHAKLMQVI